MLLIMISIVYRRRLCVCGIKSAFVWNCPVCVLMAKCIMNLIVMTNIVTYFN